MRRENFLGRDGGVVEKAIGGERVVPAVAGPVDARLRIGGQGLQHFLTASIQSFVAPADAVEFGFDSFAHRFAPCRNDGS